MLCAAHVHRHIVALGAYAHDHAAVNGDAGADEQGAALLGGPQAVGDGVTGLKCDEAPGAAAAQVALERCVGIEYGGHDALAARVGQQIALYAYSLTIEHPTLRESMTFTCIPHGAKFDEFSDECAALAAGVRCAYIDNNLICVNKSSGISCTVEDGGSDTLEARLNSAFGKVYPLHRLDAPTSGLVLFARNAKTAAVLGEAIRQRKIKKFYQAEVFGAPPAASGSLRLFGRKDSERAFVQVFTKPVSNSFEMNTDYRLLSSNGGTSTLELLLITGKTHQIRASLAHIGCPIIGDDKYGDRVGNRSFPAGLRLTATRIVFPNKLDGLEYLCGKSIEIEPPYNTQLIKNQL